jgi:DHA2 family metal-tetracycline-proton antiporter-like MFS transporter
MGPDLPGDARYRHAALLIVALGGLMVSVDTTIVNISLPSIAASFGADPAAVSWVAMIYLIALACTLPAMGKLGDIYGYRFVFATGCGLFTVSSLMCGLSSSAIDLIVFRALQGIGAGALYAIGPAILMQFIPEEKHGWALGIMTTMVSIGIAIGPVLGGFISQYADWSWIFLVNVPVGTLMVAVTLRNLPGDNRIRTPASFDFPGALFIFLALVTLLFSVSRGLSLGWTSPLIAACLCLSVLFWILFVFRQRSTTSPLINIAIFGNGAFLAGNVVAFIMTLVINGAKYLFPFFFLDVQGLSPSVAGLILAVPAVTLIFTGYAAGALSDRYSSWALVGISFVITVVLFLLFLRFGPATPLLFIVAVFALEGIATGLYSSPNMNQILSAGGYAEKGVSSSVMMTIRNIASAMGVAIFSSVLLAGIPDGEAGSGAALGSIPPGILDQGFRAAFSLGAVLSLVALIIVVIVIVQKWSDDEVYYEAGPVTSDRTTPEYYLYIYP